MSKSSPKSGRVSGSVVWSVLASAALLFLVTTPLLAVEESAAFAGLELVDEYQAPGRIEELSGIYPHPSDANLYYVVANQGPVFEGTAQAKLPEAFRGKLLTVNRQGEVVASQELVRGDYGGLAYGEGHFFVASLEPAEILKVEPVSGKVVDRFAIAGPAGGLEYDAERRALYAQIFVGHPHLAVVDVKSGATIETLWSDESAMGLAKVGGDLLCTWANGFDANAWSELRLLDPKTGRVMARQALDGVHTSLAAVDGGFLSMVSGGDGNVVVRRYAYTAIAR